MDKIFIFAEPKQSCLSWGYQSVTRRKTDNAMAKRKGTKGQTTLLWFSKNKYFVHGLTK
jgi:hypothetical protein